MSEKYTFQDFLDSLDGITQKFASDLHDALTEYGCRAEVKSAKWLCGFIQSQ